ncbi:alpha/beta fold hydrolase [Kribbella antibiotica]|uniref:Alpha/beta fold hydrolase n=1 Tax=Kribbella antibiotica TaxID=190195 RepID=A0A4R4Z8K4_9ACTN|nr:alpha/beta fold hydrolase [Kribbella antibiotica]TDD54505.1 alpha/beta fold hydrolase [Kribbella antibiotica]
MTGSGTAQETSFNSLDGLRLSATSVTPPDSINSWTVLVHGGGATREEGGFFTRLATGLASAGIASLRFDLRGHGESSGRQEDLTLSGLTNDIRAAVEHVHLISGSDQTVNVVGASFGGGVSSYYAATHSDSVRRLVLLNPLLNYKRRLVDEKPYWHDDHIDEDAAQELETNGFLQHSPTFKLGRALVNEVFYLQPHRALPDIQVPTLFVHGTRDTFVPVDSSRWGVEQVGAQAQLLEIDGSQHGFAVHDDPQYLDPQSQRWQAEVITAIANFLNQ